MTDSRLSQPGGAGQGALRVTRRGDHRMQDAMDHQPLRADDLRHRIDQEGHVVVDDRKPHAAVGAISDHRFKQQRGRARRTVERGARREFARVLQRLVIQVVALAGQRAAVQRGLIGLGDFCGNRGRRRGLIVGFGGFGNLLRHRYQHPD